MVLTLVASWVASAGTPDEGDDNEGEYTAERGETADHHQRRRDIPRDPGGLQPVSGWGEERGEQQRGRDRDDDRRQGGRDDAEPIQRGNNTSSRHPSTAVTCRTRGTSGRTSSARSN